MDWSPCIDIWICPEAEQLDVVALLIETGWYVTLKLKVT
jgi:hypothetical protein